MVEHEVCHLEVMDHSPRFWALLGRACPDWREHSAWLRRYGVDAGARERGQRVEGLAVSASEPGRRSHSRDQAPIAPVRPRKSIRRPHGRRAALRPGDLDAGRLLAARPVLEPSGTV